MNMKFNKYLAMCFLASTLMCGSFTSCGDDDDENGIENGKTTADQASADGKKFGEDYKVVTGPGETLDKTASAISLISAADKYKKSTDNTYKTAFAEAAVEVVTGTEATGDAAVEKLNGLLHEYSSYIIGRMGIPYREKKINVMSVAIDAPQDVISTMSGKIGKLDGVSVKIAYSKVVTNGE